MTQTGKKYRISKGQKITGKLGIKLLLTYDEPTPYLVTDFKDVLMRNYISVQSIQIPLEESDEIIAALSEDEYMMRQFYSSPSPFFF